jgi:hypothetical protein
MGLPASLRLPPRPFLGGIVLRTVVVWALMRSAGAVGTTALMRRVGAVGGSVGTGSSFVRNLVPNPMSFLWIWGVVAIVLAVELVRRKEAPFLANLGISFRRIAAVAFVLCALLDIALSVGLAVATGA